MSSDLHSLVDRLEKNIGTVVLGKQEVVRLCLAALFAGEHILLEDVPGVGKTLVGKALARSVSGHFGRLQFTPDLLPSDILGSNVFDSRTAEFVFHKGPIFSNIVLADEINRAPPRTQSALLEAMSEGQVSVDGKTYPLPQPFLVIATQNPFEFEGTYALPESQLDRFLLRSSLGYPNRESERQLLDSHRHGEPVNTLDSVVTCDEVIAIQQAVRDVRVEGSVADYLLDIVHSTRECPELHVGVSTRGGLSHYRAAQAMAFIEGRDYVIPEDVKRLAPAVLAHRVVTKGHFRTGQRETSAALVRRLVDQISVPQ